MDQPKPSMGRIVHCYAFLPSNGTATCPAIITEVFSDDRVNLTVFYPDGTTGPMTYAPLVTSEAEKSWVGFWWWPPRT